MVELEQEKIVGLTCPINDVLGVGSGPINIHLGSRRENLRMSPLPAGLGQLLNEWLKHIGVPPTRGHVSKRVDIFIFFLLVFLFNNITRIVRKFARKMNY